MQVSKHSAGGKASALIQKKKSEEAYYASPVFCKNCEKMLVPKEGEKFPSVRNRKFCDKSCAGTFNNQKFPKAIVSEINSIDNLIWLCPNCHWEFDHDLTE